MNKQYSLNLRAFNEQTLRSLNGWGINALMWLLTPPKTAPTPTSSEDSREISDNNIMQAILRSDVEAELLRETLLWLSESEVCSPVNVHKNNQFTMSGECRFPCKTVMHGFILPCSFSVSGCFLCATPLFLSPLCVTD